MIHIRTQNRTKNKMEMKEIKQKIFMRFNEFKPLLTPNQYKIYVKHIEEAVINAVSEKEKKDE